jgi:plasmid segregation protein ParM
LFKKAVKEAFATHQILEVKDPMFANVRGYQIAGTNYAYTALQPAGRALRSVPAEGGGA